MPDESDTKKLLGRMSDELEARGKKIGIVLFRAQKEFEKDYAMYAAVAGSAFVAASIGLSFWGRSDGFCITLAGIGGLVFIMGLVFRHFAIAQQLKRVEALLELERESSRAARDAEIFRDWSYNGIPTDASLAKLLPLISAPAMVLSPNMPPTDGSRAEKRSVSARLEDGEAKG